MDETPIKLPTGSGRIVVAIILIGGFLLAFIGLRYRVKDPNKLPGATQPSLMEGESRGASRVP